MPARYAWPQFKSEWSLSIDRLEVEGEVMPDLVDEPNARVRLDSVEWQSASFAVTMATVERVPATLTTFEAFVLVSSPRSQTRIPVALVPIAHDEGLAFGGEVTLYRDELAGSVELHGTVVSQIEDRLRTVASSDKWTLVIDASEAPTAPGAPPFKTAWVEFGSPDAPAAVAASVDAHAFMDISTEPILYLNSRIDGLQELVHADTARGHKRWIRDLVGSSLARLALAALCRAGVNDVLAGANDGPAPPSDSLRRQALEAVAGAMPDIASADELYERLVETDLDGVAGALLLSQIDLAIDSLTHVSATIGDICEAIKYG